MQITSAEQCAIYCINSNTPTEELYSDDVCEGYEYDASTKSCKLGKTDTSATPSDPSETKKVMVKFVDPWLLPASKSKLLNFDYISYTMS